MSRALGSARTAATQARKSTENRDLWIRRARYEGSTLRAIGEAAGLSHTAIAKILAR